MEKFGKCNLAHARVHTHTHTHTHTHIITSQPAGHVKACGNIDLQYSIVASSFNMNSGSSKDTAEELNDEERA